MDLKSIILPDDAFDAARERSLTLAERQTVHRSFRGTGQLLGHGVQTSVAQLSPIFEAVPDTAVHLAIGHCNLSVARSTAGELILRYARRLAHVHLHDNRGGKADLHLALGMGDLDVARHQVRRHGTTP